MKKWFITLLAVAALSLSLFLAGCTSPVVPTPTPVVTPTTMPPVTITPVASPGVTPLPTVMPTVSPVVTPSGLPAISPIATPTQQITLRPTVTPTPVVMSPSPAPTVALPSPSPSPVPSVPAGPTYMQGIDSGLASGPVLVEFYTTTCTYCKEQSGILDQLKGQYPNVKILTYDANANRDLAKAFGISSVPTMSVIAKKNADGSYTYAGPGGKITNDRFSSRFIGLTQKDALSTAINAALSNR